MNQLLYLAQQNLSVNVKGIKVKMFYKDVEVGETPLFNVRFNRKVRAG